MRQDMFRRSVLLLLCWSILGCGLLTDDYVPGEEFIIRSFDEFLVDASSVRGIYANYDVDSIVFAYESGVSTPLNTLSEKLLKNAWILQSERGNEIEFRRRKAPERIGGFFGLEVARVAANGNRICVGWLQLDSIDGKYDLEKDVESRWARSHLWPKYEECKSA